MIHDDMAQRRAGERRAGPRGRPATAGTPIDGREWLALVALCVASIIAHLAVYPHLPATVPSHWGVNGVDGWEPKWLTLIFDAIPLLMLGLLWLIPRIDPRGRNYNRFRTIYRVFTLVFTLFLIAMTWLSDITVFHLAPAWTAGGMLSRSIFAVMGIAFVALGNYLPQVRHNYSFGVKTPWALNDEDNWRLTHRFAGGAMIIAGAAMLVAAALDGALQTSVMLVAVIGMAVADCVYSYLVFRNGNRPLRSNGR